MESPQTAVERFTQDTQALMPAMSVDVAVQRFRQVGDFIRKVLKEDTDFGTIPGTQKPCLYKPGAEKMCALFGISPQFEILKSVEEWNGEEPFFHFRYLCRLTRNGQPVGESTGSCNSRESKYRWRWVPEAQLPQGADKEKLQTRSGKATEFTFAVDKAETTGQYGKPAEHWQKFKDAIENGVASPIKKKTKTGKELDAWEIGDTLYRVPNPDIADVVNTLEKMAQKRSLVAAVLIATAVSDVFTQDLDDMPRPEPTAQSKNPTTTPAPPQAPSGAPPPTDPSPVDAAKSTEQPTAQGRQEYHDDTAERQQLVAAFKRLAGVLEFKEADLSKGICLMAGIDSLQDADLALIDSKIQILQKMNQTEARERIHNLLVKPTQDAQVSAVTAMATLQQALGSGKPVFEHLERKFGTRVINSKTTPEILRLAALPVAELNRALVKTSALSSTSSRTPLLDPNDEDSILEPQGETT